jgi:hypothetical protein
MTAEVEVVPSWKKERHRERGHVENVEYKEGKKKEEEKRTFSFPEKKETNL